MFTEQQKARARQNATRFRHFLISRNPAILKHPKGGWTLADLLFLQAKISAMVGAAPEKLRDKLDRRLSYIFADIRV